jgi:anti-anti-sigma factor
MRITTADRGDVRVLTYAGVMTLTEGADELVAAFDALLPGGPGIVLDLTQVTHIDSAGVGSVVACGKHAASLGAVMKIALAPAGGVRRVFEITQLTRGFEIFEDLEAAVASFS